MILYNIVAFMSNPFLNTSKNSSSSDISDLLDQNGKIKQKYLTAIITNLSTLNDITWSQPVNNSDILTYNGSKWVNHSLYQKTKKFISIDNSNYIITKDDMNYVDVGYIHICHF